MFMYPCDYIIIQLRTIIFKLAIVSVAGIGFPNKYNIYGWPFIYRNELKSHLIPLHSKELMLYYCCVAYLLSSALCAHSLMNEKGGK